MYVAKHDGAAAKVAGRSIWSGVGVLLGVLDNESMATVEKFFDQAGSKDPFASWVSESVPEGKREIREPVGLPLGQKHRLPGRNDETSERPPVGLADWMDGAKKKLTCL
jgi:hypothetical protein